MADTKISALAAASVAAGANEIAINEAGTTKKLTVTQLATFIPSEDQLKVTTVSLSAAQIIAMYATPIELLPAPGAGKINLISQIYAVFTYGGTQFTGGSYVDIRGQSSNALWGTAFVLAQINGTVDVIYFTQGSTTLKTTNDNLEISSRDAAFADGNGTIKIYIKYRILTL